MLITKKIYLKSRGRQYFTGFSGGEKVMLLIDELTKDLPAEHIIVADISDHLSTFSKRYGATLRYVAHKITSVKSRDESRQEGLQKMIGFARSDTEKGYSESKSITILREYYNEHPDHELKEVFSEILTRARENWQAEYQKKQKAKEIRDANRELREARNLPPLNIAVKTEDDGYIVYTGYGRQFLKSKKSNILFCYCYFRAATESEIAYAIAQQEAAAAIKEEESLKGKLYV